MVKEEEQYACPVSVIVKEDILHNTPPPPEIIVEVMIM